MLSKFDKKVKEVSLGDKNGSINLNEKLVGHTGLKKEAMLVDNFITFNLWSPERYKVYLESDEDENDELSVILTELGV